MDKSHEQAFHQRGHTEDTHIEDKHGKRCARSLPVRKMLTKTTRRCHHSTPIRMAQISTVTAPNAVRTQRSRILVHGWWDVCGTTVRNSVVVSYQTNMQLVQGPASVLVGVCPRETQTSHNARKLQTAQVSWNERTAKPAVRSAQQWKEQTVDKHKLQPGGMSRMMVSEKSPAPKL